MKLTLNTVTPAKNFNSTDLLITDVNNNSSLTNYLKDLHQITLETTPSLISSMTVGSSLTCFGQVLSMENNVNILKYGHYAGGYVYTFEPPILFVTFHLIKNN